ncbi:MAG: tRNA 5-methoxyuridine(34)/uridine 5-oxyacetic acid(34) synthase CmoB [Ghiorsea sp.]
MDSYITHEQDQLKQALQHVSLQDFADELLHLNHQGWQSIQQHGDFQRWQAGFEALPDVQVNDVDLLHTVRIADASACAESQQAILTALQTMHPWRKGPFAFFGVDIDTEWRSDWKWDRVVGHISSLQGRSVLDIGCGSGYHLWRMLGEKADLAVGIDPSPLFSFHFATMKRYMPDANAFVLPTGIDEMPLKMGSFDTVFSMGVLYHRKSPIDHLYQIKSLLRDGGEMVLETLVVDGDAGQCLVPQGRYAKMRNVWFIPSVLMLEVWLKRAGFKHVRCVDENVTSIDEQRSTDWMRFESLADYLDPNDHTKTIEGYPAPRRAVMVATK